MNRSNLCPVLFFLILFFNITVSNDVEDLCTFCKCGQPSNNTKTINCANTNERTYKELKFLNLTGKNLALSFANTAIEHLTLLPKVNADTFSLSLKNCSIHEIDGNVFLDAPNITYLDLSSNLITYEYLDTNIFRGPYSNRDYEPIKLMDLDLSNNYLTALEPNIFEHTPNLTYLDLSSNPLNVLNDDFFMAMRSLKYLHSIILQNTSLTGPLDLQNDYEEEVVLESVKFLDVSFNNFATVPIFFTAMFPNLEILIMDGNPIEELNDESFLGLNKLRELHLSHMPNLRRIYHHTFTNLPELRTLYLSYNRNLVHINMYAFGEEQSKHPPIRELYIINNNLRELNKDLLNWTSLSIFEHGGNHWMCHCNKTVSVHCGCDEPESVEKRTLFIQNYEFQQPIQPTSTWGPGRIILSVIVAGLCVIAGVFTWRILIKYRSFRTVNNDYPVFYASVPTVH